MTPCSWVTTSLAGTHIRSPSIELNEAGEAQDREANDAVNKG